MAAHRPPVIDGRSRHRRQIPHRGNNRRRHSDGGSGAGGGQACSTKNEGDDASTRRPLRRPPDPGAIRPAHRDVPPASRRSRAAEFCPASTPGWRGRVIPGQAARSASSPAVVAAGPAGGQRRFAPGASGKLAPAGVRQSFGAPSGARARRHGDGHITSAVGPLEPDPGSSSPQAGNYVSADRSGIIAILASASVLAHSNMGLHDWPSSPSPESAPAGPRRQPQADNPA